MDDVISVPAGRTFDLIAAHSIHACPDAYRYARDARYMAFRAKGGRIDALFPVARVFERINPRSGAGLEGVPKADRQRIQRYINERGKFRHNDEAPSATYRFYMLARHERIELPDPIEFPGQQGHRYHSFEDLGLNAAGEPYVPAPSGDAVLSALADDEAETTPFEPHSGDSRPRVARLIAARRGQADFRRLLLERYSGRCVVTGCYVPAVLEAAHVCPYRHERDNHPANGLLLRADIHTLFDLNQIGIDPESLRVIVRPEARRAGYETLHGTRLFVDTPSARRPSLTALKTRWALFTTAAAH
jgi:hypothetical protein